jgi:hypothetical protein
MQISAERQHTLDRVTISQPTCSAFAVGSWFTMNYGFTRYKFYIAEVAENRYRLSRRGWCSTDGVWMDRKEMESPVHRAEYIGQGRFKKLWKWLPWKDVVVPFLEPNSILPQPDRE